MTRDIGDGAALKLPYPNYASALLSVHYSLRSSLLCCLAKFCNGRQVTE